MSATTVPEMAVRFRKSQGGVPIIEKILSECETAHPNSPKQFFICVVTKLREYFQEQLKELEELPIPNSPSSPRPNKEDGPTMG